MSISLNGIAWEVDPLNGSPSNAGGFNWGVTSPGTDKSYGSGQAAVVRADLVCHTVGAPAAPTVNASGTGGTVAAGTYSVVVTYLGGAALTSETLPSAATSVTVTSGQDIVVTSPAAATGAKNYKVYISAVGTTTPLFLQDTAAGTALGASYTLASAVNVATANPPVSDSSGILLTSAGTPFDATDVGNLVQVTAGTGWTLDFYSVQGVVAGTAVMDRSPSPAGTTGGTGTLGGALANVLNLPVLPGSNKVFIKGNAACVMGSTWTISATAVDGTATPPTLVSGYGATRGDGAMATLQASANAITLVNCTGNGAEVEYLILDGNSHTGTTGCALASFSSMRNCKVMRYATNGVNIGSNGLVFDSEFTGGASGSFAVHANSSVGVHFCYIHDNAGVGVFSPGGLAAKGNVVVNNTGTFTDGFQVGGNSFLFDNIIRGNGRNGVAVGGTSNYAFAWTGNVVAGNGAAGLVGAGSAGISANASSDGNAFFSNGAGGTVNRLNMDDGTATSVWPINAVAPYVDAHDKVLTGDPFVNAAGGNYALNNTAGAGAAARAAGYPASLAGLSGTTGYRDLGAFQHQDSGGGSAPPRINSILIN